MDTQSILSILASSQYSATKPYRQALLNNQPPNIIQITQKAIIQILQSSNHPMQFLMAIKFAKDLIETFNDSFIQSFQYSVLPLIEHICEFDKENLDENRGKQFFGQKKSKEIETIGNSVLRLSLECVRVWSKWFQIHPETKQVSEYKICYEKLAIMKVKFPSNEYFTFEEIVKHMPNEMIPIYLLNQMRAKILLNLHLQGTVKLNENKLKELEQKAWTNNIPEIQATYGTKLWKAYRKQKKINNKKRISGGDMSKSVGSYPLKDNKDSHIDCNNQIQNLQQQLQEQQELNKKLSEQLTQFNDPNCKLADLLKVELDFKTSQFDREKKKMQLDIEHLKEQNEEQNQIIQEQEEHIKNLQIQVMQIQSTTNNKPTQNTNESFYDLSPVKRLKTEGVTSTLVNTSMNNTNIRQQTEISPSKQFNNIILKYQKCCFSNKKHFIL